MKAKLQELPKSRRPVLGALILLIICFSVTQISVEAKEASNLNTLPYKLENELVLVDTRTSSDILAEIDQGAKEIQQIKQEKMNAQKAAEEAQKAALAAEEARYQSVGVCGYISAKKTYMDYRSINSQSTQMDIIRANTTVRDDGLLLTSDGFVGAALGSTYGPLGSKFRVTTDSGKVFKVIKVDEKSDAHTTNGCQDSSGAIIEFVIDIGLVQASYPQATFAGDLNAIDMFHGNIVAIEKYN